MNNKSNLKLTIIIPTYNSELTIERCIKSLLVQEEPAQLIFVDDGSVDRTVDIIKKHCNNNVTLITTSHVGPSKARNIGLKNVITRWVTFVDSDDYVDPDYTKALLRVLHKGVSLSMCEQHGKNSVSKVYKTNEEFIEDLVTDKINSSVWGKVFDMQIIRNQKIHFKNDIFLGEDTLFCITYALSCHGTFLLTGLSKYFYTDSRNSLSSLFSIKNDDVVRSFNVIKAYEQILSLVSKVKFNNIIKLVKLKLIVLTLNCYRKALLNDYRGKEKSICQKILMDNLTFIIMNGSIRLKLKVLLALFLPWLICYFDNIRYKAIKLG
ncbi:glycosyltransferase family 2 protein [Limosilactobacillus sp. STM2_1]|uniref:Glycosyltransferase family 2 protein n=1 Tax=Limosilactobacillus rudii TaxID=2759755 RepID=A0A7W3UJS8_9LACO|nr:glycosyltransferase family 2 protein [Limosilactobacillus rudii]MBB1080295.1 glycosyltransferase family 2 protein [Limosilactobacillus rudii]MBB1096801.1 glycosyltransferase family 2 protein [Limosilactobacillus rudii]MCD7133698.1 glycosyltransferase family 2 protein [Limosilactobacillus rudii]